MKRSTKHIKVYMASEYYGLILGREAILKKDYFYNGEGHYKGIWTDTKEKFECPSVFFEDLKKYDNKMILIEKTKHKDGENIYKYQTENKVYSLSFKMHPKKAWAFAVLDNPQGLKNAILNDILDAFILQGMEQSKYKGGFDEAVKILEF